jgi:predicted amidophosphoribosyltransferase
MVDRCVICGATVPEGTMVCKRCENGSSNDRVLCPQCGTVLEPMSSHWYNTCDGHARNTVFHCNTCQSDWEKDEEFIAKPVKFTRKFWG